MDKKKCEVCSHKIAITLFAFRSDKTNVRKKTCNSCLSKKRAKDRAFKKKYVYPYKNNVLKCPKYLNDRDKLFKKHGNGWWYGWSKDNTPLKGVYSDVPFHQSQITPKRRRVSDNIQEYRIEWSR